MAVSRNAPRSRTTVRKVVWRRSAILLALMPWGVRRATASRRASRGWGADTRRASPATASTSGSSSKVVLVVLVFLALAVVAVQVVVAAVACRAGAVIGDGLARWA